MSVTSISTIAMATWPLADLLETVARLPVDQVAIGARQLDRTGWATAEEMLRSSGLRIGSLGSGLTARVDLNEADGPDEESRWRHELDLLERSVDLAARLGVPLVTLTTGRAGRLSWEDALEAFAARIGPLVQRARDAGVGLTLENTHSLRSDVSFLHSLRDAVDAAHHVGVGVCADLYCCWAERDLPRTLADGRDVVRIVQVGDFVHGTLTQPNRWVPGDGDLPLERLVADVRAAGCDELLEIEILGPRIDEEGIEPAHVRALEWLDRQLS